MKDYSLAQAKTDAVEVLRQNAELHAAIKRLSDASCEYQRQNVTLKAARDKAINDADRAIEIARAVEGKKREALERQNAELLEAQDRLAEEAVAMYAGMISALYPGFDRGVVDAIWRAMQDKYGGAKAQHKEAVKRARAAIAIDLEVPNRPEESQ